MANVEEESEGQRPGQVKGLAELKAGRSFILHMNGESHLVTFVDSPHASDEYPGLGKIITLEVHEPDGDKARRIPFPTSLAELIDNHRLFGNGKAWFSYPEERSDPS
jgi:hypothetical protein